MELEKIKVDAEQVSFDELALEVDGICVKKNISYEAKRAMASVLEGLLVIEDDKNGIIYESTMYDVAFFVVYCIFYTNIDADLSTSDKWIELYDYATKNGYPKAFYEASKEDLDIVRGMYQRLMNMHIEKYKHDHSLTNQIIAMLKETEDEASVKMGERMLDILEDKTAPVTYLNTPFSLAKKNIE